MADAALRFDPMATFAGIKPYFSDGSITIYNCDCRDFIEEFVALDAFVYADPPYGMRERTKRRSAGRSGLALCNDFPEVIGDDEEFDPRPWLRCRRVVLWGGSHFPRHLPRNGTWLCWDKRDGVLVNDNSDFEIAWSNLPGPDRLMRHAWAGMIKASEQSERRTHPTQKPVALARWVFGSYCDDDDLIVDPFMGSGSALIAGKQMGRSAIGFELSEEYCRIAVERLQGELQFGPQYPKTKFCPSCQRTLIVQIGTTFNRKRGPSDGLQPWCRECDGRNKFARKNGWKNFRRRLEEIGATSSWTQVKYESLMMSTDYHCHWCGNPVDEWSQGYWVDKLSASRGYESTNCVPCCWPCNEEKSNKNPEAWHAQIADVLRRYPRGKVPWNELSPKHRHVSQVVPSLNEYVIREDDRQQTIFGGR